MFYPSKFENRGGNALFNAQHNLRTRTHYLDDDSLRFHKSRVLSCHITDDGLLLGIVESVGLDWGNTRRGFRPVVFDIFGNVIDAVSLGVAFNRAEPARKALWAKLNSIDAKAHTREALQRAEAGIAQAFNELEASL